MPHAHPHAALALLGCLLLPGVARASDAPTMDELKQMYDAKQYKELVPKLSKALALHGPAAAGYDPYDLLVMKGEASLRLKSKGTAMDAFKEAAKATAEPPKATVATATALLLRDATGTLTYVPKTGFAKDEKPDPIDVVEPDGRKSAFGALEHDLLAKAKPKVEAARKGTNLSAMLEAAKGLADVRAVEFAMDGSDGDVNALLGDLGTRVCTLLDTDMDATVQRLNGDVKYLNDHSKEQLSTLRPSLVTLSNDAKTGDGEVSQVRDVARQMPVYFGTVTDFKPTSERAAKLEKQLASLRRELKQAGIPGIGG